LDEHLRALTFLSYNRVVDVNDILLNIDNDLYYLIIRELIRKQVIKKAIIVYISDGYSETIINGIKILFVKKYSSLPKEALSTRFLWVRGDKKEYSPWIRAGVWKRRIFYGASSYYFPYRTYGYDGILVDENTHYKKIKESYTRPLPLKFIKPANEEVFRKLGDIPKKYDICVFSTLHKSPQTFRKLYALFPSLQYVIIGRDNLNEIEDLKDFCNITFAGFIPHSEANKLLNQSKIGVVLSEKDGAPRVIIESMSAGLPQLLNEKLVIGKSYLNENTGCFFGESNLKEKVEELLSKYQIMEPEKYYKEHFSLHKAVDQMENNIQKIDLLTDYSAFFKLKILFYNLFIIAKTRGHFMKRYCLKKFYDDIDIFQ